MAALSTTNKRLLQANTRALLLRSVETWVGIQNIMGYVLIADRKLWFPYDRTIAVDRRRSQTIAEDRTYPALWSWLEILFTPNRYFKILKDKVKNQLILRYLVS